MLNPKMMFNSLTMLPTPTSIGMMWNMGFLLGNLLTFQLISGILLSMNYVPSSELAFSSLIHILRDVNFGWFMRLTHCNIASFFFLFTFLHMSRGLYFNSSTVKKNVWMIGVSIFILLMAIAFFGYVLPWGQMSFWGATVITNIASSIPYIGDMLLKWLWGNFFVGSSTINRFFSIHFFLPFVLSFFSLIHIFFLHFFGSSISIGCSSDSNKLEFFEGFFLKDLMMLMFLVWSFLFIIFIEPFFFSDSENFNEADSMVAPMHIKPEWYFLFAYAILRSIPSKFGGVISLVLSILVFYFRFFLVSNISSSKFSPLMKLKTFSFFSIFVILSIMGGSPVEYPFSMMSKVLSLLYFLFVW